MCLGISASVRELYTLSSGALPVLYRLIRAEAAREEDFYSMMLLGIRKPVLYERDHPEIWAGLSMFNAESEARRRAQRFRKLGRWIARIEGLDPEWVILSLPDESGHHTVWGRPRLFLEAVTSVTTV